MTLGDRLRDATHAERHLGWEWHDAGETYWLLPPGMTPESIQGALVALTDQTMALGTLPRMTSE